MKRIISIVVLFAGIMAAAAARAETLVGKTTLAPNTIANLLGASAVAQGAVSATNMSDGQLSAEVLYQVYANDSDQYLYLYQVNNTGTAGINSAAELFTLGMIAGTIETGGVGYLTETPSDFLGAPQQATRATCYIDNSLLGGLEVSFSYLKDDDLAIAPGERSVVMYLLSDCAPGDIYGSVIDHTTGGGYILGPAVPTGVPEPGACALLAAALVGFAVFGRLRRK